MHASCPNCGKQANVTQYGGQLHLHCPHCQKIDAINAADTPKDKWPDWAKQAAG